MAMGLTRAWLDGMDEQGDSDARFYTRKGTTTAREGGKRGPGSELFDKLHAGCGRIGCMARTWDRDEPNAWGPQAAST
jgi:hypothetical protein